MCSLQLGQHHDYNCDIIHYYCKLAKFPRKSRLAPTFAQIGGRGGGEPQFCCLGSNAQVRKSWRKRAKWTFGWKYGRSGDRRRPRAGAPTLATVLERISARIAAAGNAPPAWARWVSPVFYLPACISVHLRRLVVFNACADLGDVTHPKNIIEFLMLMILIFNICKKYVSY